MAKILGSCSTVSNQDCSSNEMLDGSNGKPHVKTWHCGTLTYTKMGLISLFTFMIWGDFCNTLMQTVVPSILPLKIKSLGGSNLMIGLFASTLPSILAAVMCPYISFKSDRHRGKWGRRIPFILFTLPPLCISLVVLAFGEDIAKALTTHVQMFSTIAPATLALIVIGIFFVIYQFFDLFVSSVFCGLFNDVVPTPLLGRFMGTMRIVGSSAGFLYGYFVYQYAESHMKEIFLCASVLYFLGVGMMCFFVKEGSYPPPSEGEKKAARGLGGIKSYFRESFCHKFYWTKFIITGCGALSGAYGVFMVFFYKDMGLTLADIGKAGAIISLVYVGTAYFVSVFVDRWHPIRIVTYGAIFGVVFTSSNAVWLFITLSPTAFFWLHMLGTGLILALGNSIAAVASLPFDMRLHPKSRFTQFCSAQALLRHLGLMVSGVLVGLFFDGVKWFFPASDYAYRFWFVWNIIWWVPVIILSCSLYRQWHALGGDKSFHAPAPWLESGYEEQEQSPYVGPQSKWLRIDMWVISAVMLISVIYLVPLSLWLWQNGWSSDFNWHLIVILPGALAIYIFWLFVERSLKSDIERCQAGEAPLNGIPHHGMVLLQSLCLLLLLGIWIGKTIAAINDGLQGGVIALGIGNLTTNILFIAAILLLRRLERGHPPLLDYDGRHDMSNTTEQPLVNTSCLEANACDVFK